MQNATLNGTSCNACVFFDDHGTGTVALANEGGLCRFNPPVSQPDANSRGLWPVVTAEDWCGHFTSPHGRMSASA